MFCHVMSYYVMLCYVVLQYKITLKLSSFLNLIRTILPSEFYHRLFLILLEEALVAVTLPVVEETKLISNILADFLSLRAGNSVCRHALRSLRPHRCVCVFVVMWCVVM
jgi:hypothetical protein